MHFSSAAAFLALSSVGLSYAVPVIHPQQANGTIVRRQASYSVVNVGGDLENTTASVKTVTEPPALRSPVTVTVEVTDTPSPTPTPSVTPSPIASAIPDFPFGRSGVPAWGSASSFATVASRLPGDEKLPVLRRESNTTYSSSVPVRRLARSTSFGIGARALNGTGAAPLAARSQLAGINGTAVSNQKIAVRVPVHVRNETKGIF